MLLDVAIVDIIVFCFSVKLILGAIFDILETYCCYDWFLLYTTLDKIKIAYFMNAPVG